MNISNGPEAFLPSDLLTKVQARAAAEQRKVLDVIQDAVERYLEARLPLPASQPIATRSEAAARMLERRHRHRLPDGETVKDLMTYGRA